jgi:hypothetical protein
MGKFDDVVMNKYQRNKGFLFLYKILSCFWKIDNSNPLFLNKKCYKILAFDTNDDVIDIFSSLH